MQVSEPITLALRDLAGGDNTAMERILPHVYAELRRLAAHVMRQILIDHARGRNASKRGAGQVIFSLDESMDTPEERDSTVVRVDDALRALEQHDARKAKLIEMRFFGGMTAEESAEVLGLPTHTVRSELRVAQAWLRRELNQVEGAKK
jgi:RNA polymerase sigma-70 factor (ECF subfamily)